jgi:hypothetical protein
MKINKTISNLEKVWKQLDDVYGLLDNALTDINLMKDMPKEVIKSSEMIDFSAIVRLKNEIEEMIEKKKTLII